MSGFGAQECSNKAMVPMTMATGDTGTFQTPVIPNSDVPALLGMKTLEARRALLDIRGRKLYFLGPGEYSIQLPPGSVEVDLEKTESGHLLLPITEFKNVTKVKPDNNNYKTPNRMSHKHANAEEA